MRRFPLICGGKALSSWSVSGEFILSSHIARVIPFLYYLPISFIDI
ncbi:hypothetical protein AB06_2215 [Escherichia coli 2-474-04_S1_C1]|nr:hypothetical protein AB06_2215 [Escherichia coli 2-474-04_S1_C1]